MRKQQEERCGRHAVEPRRLAEARRPVALELLPEFRRQAGNPVKGKFERDDDALLSAEGGDVELLALEIDRVTGIDGELLGDLGVEVSDLRPDASEGGEVDIGIGEKLVGA